VVIYRNCDGAVCFYSVTKRAEKQGAVCFYSVTKRAEKQGAVCFYSVTKRAEKQGAVCFYSVTKRAEKHMGPEDLELYCFDVAALNSKGTASVKKKVIGETLEKKTRKNRKILKVAHKFDHNFNEFEMNVKFCIL
jgi:hypothetical protein